MGTETGGGRPATGEATAPADLGETLPSGDGDVHAAGTRSLTTAGASIGRYVVLSELGAGAMGVVLAAYDPELDRKVALKLLRSPRDRGMAQRRLQREAQALAKLSHRNVVAVHDVGVHEEQVFIAMEYVDGQTLGEWLAAKERSWQEIVDLMVAAGRGLHAAHEAGLIHRDFKPDNVMVGPDSVPRVMDFGLARSDADDEEDGDPSEGQGIENDPGGDLTSVRLTRTGAILGTPAYMAPEQFMGAPTDARTDQFGFCVTLYQALYGERPYAGDTVASLCLAVNSGRVGDAPGNTKVPAWLRKVVVQGLAPGPADRHPSMLALLERLGHGVRGGKRRTIGFAAGAVGVLALSAFAMRETTPRLCAQAASHLEGVWDEARQRAVRDQLAKAQPTLAEQVAPRLVEVLDEYAAAWVTAREDACEATHVRGEQSSELLDLRMACYDDRLAAMGALVDVLTEADAEVVGHAIQAAVGLEALDSCANTGALTSGVEAPDAAILGKVGEVEEALVRANALRAAGRYSDGESLAAQSVELAHETGYAPVEVRAQLGHALLQRELGRFELAEASLAAAYEGATRQGMIREAAEAAAWLTSLVADRLSRPAQGLQWALSAKALADRTGVAGAIARALESEGTALAKVGKFEEARASYERALALREREHGPNHPAVAATLSRLGDIATEQGEYEIAERVLLRATAIMESALGPGHPDLAAPIVNQANVLQMRGEFKEARVQYQRAHDILVPVLGPDHPRVAHALMGLGQLDELLGDPEAGLKLYERALAIRITVHGEDHRDVAYTLQKMAMLTDDLGRAEETREMLERALAIREKVFGPDDPEVAKSLVVLGDMATNTGRHDEARSLLTRALSILEKALGREHREVGIALLRIGALELSAGRAREATLHLQRSVNVLDAALGTDHIYAAYPLTALGQAYLDLARPEEAAMALEHALKIRLNGPSLPPDVATTRSKLARALIRTDPDRARALSQEAATAYEAAGENWVTELANERRWLARHR